MNTFSHGSRHRKGSPMPMPRVIRNVLAGALLAGSIVACLGTTGCSSDVNSSGLIAAGGAGGASTGAAGAGGKPAGTAGAGGGAAGAAGAGAAGAAGSGAAGAGGGAAGAAGAGGGSAGKSGGAAGVGGA